MITALPVQPCTTTTITTLLFQLETQDTTTTAIYMLPRVLPSVQLDGVNHHNMSNQVNIPDHLRMSSSIQPIQQVTSMTTTLPSPFLILVGGNQSQSHRGKAPPIYEFTAC